ncbi:MAG: ABC transporter family substrate-binding protein [Nitriliruptoraceae bacterium]
MRSSIGRRWRWPLLLTALALILAACAADDEDGEDEPDDDVEDVDDEEDDDGDEEDDGDDEEAGPVEGGTVLFGDEQEPTILNSFLIDGNSLVTSKVASNIWPGSYVIQPDFSLEPSLIDGEAEITEDPFTVTYTIKDEAEWSDGTPITVDDYIFTFETIMTDDEEVAEQITSTNGYDLIEDYETDGDKTITFTFEEPYGPWQLLFSEILPAHVLEGEDFATVLNESYPEISGGPFMFDEWEQGTQLRLVRNENYWGGDVALDEIVMRYVPDTTTLTQQMVGGELDMYDPQPQIELVEELEGASDRLEYEVGLGPVWEHIDFNTLVPGLDKDYVRQAIAMGIDRQQIVETLIQPVDPEAEVLNNPFWMANSDNYEPTYDQWEYDPEGARQLLEDNGCEDQDGTYVCDGDELSFRIGTTGGNERRELAQQLMQSNLAEVGIDIEIDNDEGAAFFDRLNTPENCDGVCDYDIALFAWVGSPNPQGNANIYGCDDWDADEPTPRAQNWHVFCDEELTELMDEANATIDPEENARLWNEAAEIMAENVPVLPLFQQPQLLAYENTLTGPQLNATNQTQFWNSQEWAYTE